MSTQHTPGPWEIEQTESHNWIGQMRPDCAKVGVVVTHTDRAGYNPNTTARNDANARLISAAPELLKALQDLLRQTSTIEVLGEWEALDVNTGLRKTNRARVDETIRAACAAIDKATKGES